MFFQIGKLRTSLCEGQEEGIRDLVCVLSTTEEKLELAEATNRQLSNVIAKEVCWGFVHAWGSGSCLCLCMSFFVDLILFLSLPLFIICLTRDLSENHWSRSCRRS